MAHINLNVGAVVLTKSYTPEAPPCKELGNLEPYGLESCVTSKEHEPLQRCSVKILPEESLVSLRVRAPNR